MPDVKELQPPSSGEAILGLLETQRTKVTRWKAARAREIELEAERELAAIERIAGALDQGARTCRAPAKPSRPKKGKTPAALAAERRGAIERLLTERQEPLPINEISRTLRLSEFSTRSALKRLCKERRLRRVGTGSNTRYAVRSGRSSAVRDESGPPPGRVLEIIRDRSAATLAELVQATNLDEEKIRRICGGLITDGEIQMGRRDDQAVYVARRAA